MKQPCLCGFRRSTLLFMIAITDREHLRLHRLRCTVYIPMHLRVCTREYSRVCPRLRTCICKMWAVPDDSCMHQCFRYCTRCEASVTRHGAFKNSTCIIAGLFARRLCVYFAKRLHMPTCTRPGFQCISNHGSYLLEIYSNHNKPEQLI